MGWRSLGSHGGISSGGSAERCEVRGSRARVPGVGSGLPVAGELGGHSGRGGCTRGVTKRGSGLSRFKGQPMILRCKFKRR